MRQGRQTELGSFDVELGKGAPARQGSNPIPDLVLARLPIQFNVQQEQAPFGLRAQGGSQREIVRGSVSIVRICRGGGRRRRGRGEDVRLPGFFWEEQEAKRDVSKVSRRKHALVLLFPSFFSLSHFVLLSLLGVLSSELLE